MGVKFSKYRKDESFYFKAKYSFIYCVILLLFFVIGFRIFYIVKYGPVFEQNLAESERVLRRNIVDRNGAIIATNLITYTLYAKPSVISDPKKFAKSLHKIFPEMSEVYFFNRIKDKDRKGIVLLSRDITPKQKNMLMQEGLVGLYFNRDVKRIYPHRNLFSQVVGFVDSDERGLAGIEKFFDDQLSDKKKQYDHNLELSLDLNVQTIVHQELSKTIKKFSALGGAAIVASVENGEILSLVSLPDYDPYSPAVSLHDKNFNNKASFNLYELGSTMKVITMSAALENKIVNLHEVFDVSKPLVVSSYKITDFKPIKEPITIREILSKSSNIGTAQVALRLGEDRQKEFLKKLRIFDPLQIEVVEKSFAKMPSRWGLSKTVTASYGYGVSLTPIHMMQAVSSIANGGYFYPFTLLKGKNDNYVPTKVYNESNSKIIRSLMRGVVDGGTGHFANSKFYEIAGKTGTSNKIGQYGYIEGSVIASFIGYFPYDNPKYIVYVVVDDPKGIKETYGYATGGYVGAPTVKNIVERIAPLLSVYPAL